VALTLVDTSSWIEALRKSGDPKVRERIRILLESGEAAWCDLVRLEMWNGAAGEAEKKTLRLFERDLSSLQISAPVWELSFELARRLRSAGLSVPSTDILILACSRHHRVPLEHFDRHFDEAVKFLGGP